MSTQSVKRIRLEETFSLAPLPSQRNINQMWLEKVLSHKLDTGVSIQSWTVKSPERREGFSSEICFVRVSYLTSRKILEERALVVKFMPQDRKVVEFMNSGNLGKREVEFYKYTHSKDFRVFFQKCGLINPVPDVYWADIKGNVLTIVLPDLNIYGYKVLAPAEGNSVNQVKCIFQSISVIHALGIATIGKHGEHSLNIPWSYNFIEPCVKEGIEKQIQIFDRTPTADILKSLLPLSAELITVSQRYHFVNTIIHGDLWAGNIMFSNDNKLAYIIDWQFVSIGNPVCDIICFLLLSANPSVYNEHLNEVLEFYWENFEQALKKTEISVNISFQDLVKNVESMWIFGFMFLSAALHDLMDTSKMSEGRLQSIIFFLKKKNVFDKFLKSCQ
ncbi:uncharacterized protein [Procambarus clarkii]|uniref:uncharacterized protein n=1 Tax=Procambarus clarkii TaxID=6728 RepID=UPI003742B19B